MFKFIDLFAGIGGMRSGFELAGGQCVFSSDIDKECQQTYLDNYGELPHGDITQIDPNDIPGHDILCAGIPCQSFSVSGKQKGFDDIRGTLFFNVLEIIKIKKPKIVCIENVKNLMYHDSGRTLKVIINNLNDCGYNVVYNILNAKDFGLAQNRERIFIIASKDSNVFDFNDIKRLLYQQVIKSILDNNINSYNILLPNEYTLLPKSLWKRQQGSGLIFCGYRNKNIRQVGIKPNTLHLSRTHKQPNRIYHIDGTHPTLPSQETSGRFWIYDDNIVRKLTIIECYRLMGFPDNFKKSNVTSTAYKQIGNSIAIPVVEAVAKSICRQLMMIT